MAFSSSNFYQDDLGEYHQPTYQSSYSIFPNTYYSYEFNGPKPIDYFHNVPYENSYPSNESHDPSSYDPSFTQLESEYSEYRYVEPKFLQYVPSSQKSDYFSYGTHYTVSYSAVESEFTDPVFLEYDPTPYGGGYDSTVTYGNPLPPSDEICHPRSIPLSDAPSFDGFSYASIPSPYGHDAHSTDDLTKPSGKEIKPTDPGDESKQPDGDKPLAPSPSDESKQLNGDMLSDSGQGEQTDIDDVEGSRSDHDNGHENGRNREISYGSAGEAPQYPYGYGLEAMDLCESIFGYWPCLYKEACGRKGQNHSHQDDGVGEGYENPWKCTADYLFGSPYVYVGEERDRDGRTQNEVPFSWL